MAKAPKAASTRKPPEPSDTHDVIDEWMERLMPDLQPIVERADEMIRTAHPGAQFAVKWKKAHYGLPDQGWIIEVVAYDVSVNLVFFGGADFDAPPPLGTGRSRYIKVTSVDELDQPELQAWIDEAGRTPGWT
jgi:hypothetical protein